MQGWRATDRTIVGRGVGAIFQYYASRQKQWNHELSLGRDRRVMHDDGRGPPSLEDKRSPRKRATHYGIRNPYWEFIAYKKWTKIYVRQICNAVDGLTSLNSTEHHSPAKRRHTTTSHPVQRPALTQTATCALHHVLWSGLRPAGGPGDQSQHWCRDRLGYSVNRRGHSLGAAPGTTAPHGGKPRSRDGQTSGLRHPQ